MKVTVMSTHGFGPALLGARLSHQSRSDSVLDSLGPRDKKLMLTLAARGPSHRKFLRAIQVWLDIKAPIGWWVQFDTYKVATTRLSESTMHSLDRWLKDGSESYTSRVSNKLKQVLREVHISTNQVECHDIDILRDNLPMGLELRSIVNLNYETLLNIYFQRKTHKSKYWHEFLTPIMRDVPYFSELAIAIERKKNGVKDE